MEFTKFDGQWEIVCLTFHLYYETTKYVCWVFLIIVILTIKIDRPGNRISIYSPQKEVKFCLNVIRNFQFSDNIFNRMQRYSIFFFLILRLHIHVVFWVVALLIVEFTHSCGDYWLFNRNIFRLSVGNCNVCVGLNEGLMDLHVCFR